MTETPSEAASQPEGKADIAPSSPAKPSRPPIKWWIAAALSYRKVAWADIHAPSRRGRLRTWGGRIIYWGQVFAYMWIPNWAGEWTPYFLATLSIGAAWGVAAPHLLERIDRADVARLRPHINSLGQPIAEEMARRGYPIANPSEEQQKLLLDVVDGFLRAIYNALRRLFVDQVTAVMGMLVVSLIGLMIAPALESRMLGPFHVVRLLYALTLPHVLSIFVAITGWFVVMEYLHAYAPPAAGESSGA